MNMNGEPQQAISQGQGQTLGQHLDEQIARHRKELELAVVTRAKAEHMQMLDYPMSFIYQLTAF